MDLVEKLKIVTSKLFIVYIVLLEWLPDCGGASLTSRSSSETRQISELVLPDWFPLSFEGLELDPARYEYWLGMGVALPIISGMIWFIAGPTMVLNNVHLTSK